MLEARYIICYMQATLYVSCTLHCMLVALYIMC
jgi:hypothetical protein